MQERIERKQHAPESRIGKGLMRPIVLRAVLVLATVSALLQAPVHAAPSASESGSKQGQSETFFAAYNELLHAKQYDAILEMTRRQRVPSANYEGRAIVAAMSASALIGLERAAEAEKLIDEAYRLAPNSPEPTRILWLSTLIIERLDFAAEALDRLIAKFPDVARQLEWDHVAFLLRNEPDGQERRNEDRRIDLARIGFGGDTHRGHYLAEDAIGILMERGDVAGAAELVPYAKQLDSVENMLIQKRFGALWPQIEKLAGPQLEKITARTIASAAKLHAQNPNDPEKLKDFARALFRAGRFNEAIALRAKLPKTSIEMAAANQEMGWVVNYVALALHRAGRADEADQLFALLNDAPMQNGRWRVSMKINRLELLVSDGRFDRARQLLDMTEQSAKTEGNKYAQQVLRRLRYCTMVGLGRKQEATMLRSELVQHTDDAPAVTIEAFLCAGDLDAAERLALETLRKKEWFPERFVRQLQAKPLSSSDPSIWQVRWKELRARPAIAREFDRLGRDIPQALLPTAAR